MFKEESNEDIEQINLYNFIINKGNNKGSKFVYYNPKKIYIILKEDYFNGIKYLESNIKESQRLKEKNEKKAYPNRISFFNKKDKFDIISNIKELSIVNEDFLISLNIEKDNYKNKSVNFYEIESKKYLGFRDGTLVEISNLEVKDKNYKEIMEGDKVLDSKDLILKILILIYANEKEILKLLKLPI